MSITMEKEKLRMEEVKDLAENWDKIPEELRGELAGTVRTMKRIYVDNPESLFGVERNKADLQKA